MAKREQLLTEFATLITFIESLRSLDNQLWSSSLGEGKWTPRDVVAHIMLWDKYFLESAIEKIANNQSLTLKNMDFDEFNRHSREYAESISEQEILDLTIRNRSEILNLLESLSDEDFIKEYMDGDGNEFSIYQYLEDFISHDLHHINQLKAILKL